MQQMLGKLVSRVQFATLRYLFKSFLLVRSCFIIIIMKNTYTIRKMYDDQGLELPT